jgi:hypothetical protein
MPRRGLFPLLILACAVSGCASLQAELADAPSDDAPAPVARTTPQAAYDAGVLDMVRGDDAGARSEWNRCLAISSADSPSRLDCLVALEKLASPSSLEP